MLLDEELELEVVLEEVQEVELDVVELVLEEYDSLLELDVDEELELPS